MDKKELKKVNTGYLLFELSSGPLIISTAMAFKGTSDKEIPLSLRDSNTAAASLFARCKNAKLRCHLCENL